MKKIFNNSYLVISIYILLGFLIDIVTNLTINLSFSIGMILRGILLLYLILGIIIKYPKKHNYFILGILGIFSIIFLIIKFDAESIKYIFKYNYVLILLLFIYNLYINEDKKINRNMLTLSLIFYSLCIIISYITKTSLDTYGISKVGYKGWFNSANEISAIISIIVSYLIINLEKRINFIEIFAIIISLLASFLIGTRLPIIVFLISILYILAKKLVKDIRRKKINYTNIILFIIFIIVFIFKFKELPLYKNIVVHIKYLKLNNPIEVLTSFKLFDHFIFNQRLTFLLNINKYMVSAPIIDKLFGLSSIGKTVEMDLFDIFYRYGLIGFIIFTFITAYIIKKFKNRNIKVLPVVVIMITSFLSGHVILSPNVSIIAVIVLANTLYKRNSKKILISAYSMNIGGIEQSLVTFIDKLIKDKNEVVLFLEKKEGILLKELPKECSVKRQKVFKSKILNLINRVKFLITNFKEYDFSISYKTNSNSSNYLARRGSNNDAIYIHSDYTVLYKNNIKDINNFYRKLKLDKFRTIIFASNEARDNLVSIYPRLTDKSIVINNFIDEDKIIKLSEEKIKETKIKGKKLFLYVGKIEEESKKLTRLINAFEIAFKENKKISLFILGDGKDYNYISKYIKDKKLDKDIIMLGNKSNPYPYIKLCDYILLTSDYEGFPLIYGEAITLNKPIISTIDVTDNYISIPNNFGYICKKDEKDIASTMINILNSNYKMKKLDIKKINEEKYEMLKKII